MHEVDEYLIAQARNKATGATIHNIKGAIGKYRNSALLCKRYAKKDPPDDRLTYWEGFLEMSERKLRILVSTGKLIRSDELVKRKI